MKYQIYGTDLISDYPFSGRLFIKKEESDSFKPAQVVYFACSQMPPFPVDPELRNLIYPPLCETVGLEVKNEIYQFGAYDMIRLGWGADFYLRPYQIDCHLHNPARQALVEPHLLGTVFAFWLERQEIPVLHASAVMITEHQVLFPSHSGNGKSTLAGGFIQAGAALLTDDILPVEEKAGQFWGRPGIAQINMWPDQVKYFTVDGEGFETVSPGTSKVRVPVERVKNGTYRHESQPLACIYIPRKSDQASSGTEIQITPIPPAEAVIELVRYSYFPSNICEQLGWQSRRLDFFARLVRQVPVRRLVYPAGFEHLGRVTEAVMRDLENLPARR